ncbi:DeoR family transcriptional regulator [Salmonella enterica]|nr:DeoR family transcriptional regulator [Salmonella enterica]EBO3634464.1 DeoR family transcriptional regulator [Salmonella enterica]
MYPEERRIFILNYLDENGFGYVNFFSDYLLVSRELIRRDLNLLAKQGLVLRSYGGASIIRKNLQKELISTEQGNFEELLHSIYHATSENNLKTKGKLMINKGKVCVLGSFNVDIVAKVERFPRGGESILAKSSTIGPGGKGTNQATAANKAGAQVHFVGKVGKDQFSQLAHDYLTSTKIHSFSLYKSENEPTGSAIIYVSQENGENIIAIYPGANTTISSTEVQYMIPELSTSDVLLVQLENNFNATKAIIDIAHKMGKIVILNPAPFSHEVISCLHNVDVITPNETEASLLSGVEIINMDSAKEAAQKIANLGVRKVIITMGSKGALLLDNKQFYSIPAFPSVVIDTTGAGDAFNGALAASLAAGNPLKQAAMWASAFASLAVELEGASNMPAYDQVKRRFQNHHLNEK